MGGFSESRGHDGYGSWAAGDSGWTSDMAGKQFHSRGAFAVALQGAVVFGAEWRSGNLSGCCYGEDYLSGSDWSYGGLLFVTDSGGGPGVFCFLGGGGYGHCGGFGCAESTR